MLGYEIIQNKCRHTFHVFFLSLFFVCGRRGGRGSLDDLLKLAKGGDNSFRVVTFPMSQGGREWCGGEIQQITSNVTTSECRPQNVAASKYHYQIIIVSSLKAIATSKCHHIGWLFYAIFFTAYRFDDATSSSVNFHKVFNLKIFFQRWRHLRWRHFDWRHFGARLVVGRTEMSPGDIWKLLCISKKGEGQGGGAGQPNVSWHLLWLIPTRVTEFCSRFVPKDYLKNFCLSWCEGSTRRENPERDSGTKLLCSAIQRQSVFFLCLFWCVLVQNETLNS